MAVSPDEREPSQHAPLPHLHPIVIVGSFDSSILALSMAVRIALDNRIRSLATSCQMSCSSLFRRVSPAHLDVYSGSKRLKFIMLIY
jgi:hypothetical protein